MFDFIKRNVDQLLQEGTGIIGKKFHTLLMLAAALPIILLARLIRPLKLIRFGSLRSERIGHFAGNTEIYLCECLSGFHGSNFIDIFFHGHPVCNQQLKIMWNRRLLVAQFAYWLDRANDLLPGGDRHKIPWAPHFDRDMHDVLAKNPCQLEFTNEETQRGFEELKQQGIPEKSRYICFSCRDSAYLNTELPIKDWSYHNFRDSDILNHVQAAGEMTQRGYYLLRMGAVVNDDLRSDDPKILDYAATFRSDFMDVFLSAHCHFFICDNTGLDALPIIFRRPLVSVNIVPLYHVHSWRSDCVTIPKKLWLRKEKRFLTFGEILKTEIGIYTRTEQYLEADIEVVQNTGDEIKAVAVEMDERLRGTWIPNDGDDELQQRFWALFDKGQHHATIRSLIGAEFLRQNRDLLN